MSKAEISVWGNQIEFGFYQYCDEFFVGNSGTFGARYFAALRHSATFGVVLPYFYEVKRKLRTKKMPALHKTEVERAWHVSTTSGQRCSDNEKKGVNKKY